MNTSTILTVLASSGLMLADAATPPGLWSMVERLGVVAILIWYVWHCETRRFPKMQQQFLDTLAAERKTRVEEIGKLTEGLTRDRVRG